MTAGFCVIGDDIEFDNEKIGALGHLNATTRSRVIAALDTALEPPEQEETPAPGRTDRAAGGYFYERIGETPNPRCALYDRHGRKIGELEDVPTADRIVGLLNARGEA